MVLGARGCRYTNEVKKSSELQFRALVTEGSVRIDLLRGNTVT